MEKDSNSKKTQEKTVTEDKEELDQNLIEEFSQIALHNYGKKSYEKMKTTQTLQNASIKAVDDPQSIPDPEVKLLNDEVDFEDYIQEHETKSIKSDNSQKGHKQDFEDDVKSTILSKNRDKKTHDDLI